MDAIEYINYLMEKHNLTRSKLIFILGYRKAYISKILAKKMPLSINLIRKLHGKLCIPYDILMKEYKIKK